MVIDGIDVDERSGDPTGDIDRLLLRIADGDQEAFARLYDLLSPRMFGLILRVLVDRAQSEEVLQEVFLEIWQSASQFSPKKGQGRSWALTITHRRAVDRVRSSQASADRDVRAGFRDMGVAFDGVAEDVELRWEGRRVVEALAQPPEAQREAPVSAGVFDGGDDTPVLLEGDLAAGDVVAVTVEDAGGSPTGAPTTDPIVAVPTD